MFISTVSLKICRCNSWNSIILLNISDIASHLSWFSFTRLLLTLIKLIFNKHRTWRRWCFRASLLCLSLNWLKLWDRWLFLRRLLWFSLLLIFRMQSRRTSSKCNFCAYFFPRNCRSKASIILSVGKWFSIAFWSLTRRDKLILILKRSFCRWNIKMCSFLCESCQLLFLYPEYFNLIFFLSRINYYKNCNWLTLYDLAYV